MNIGSEIFLDDPVDIDEIEGLEDVVELTGGRAVTDANWAGLAAVMRGRNVADLIADAPVEWIPLANAVDDIDAGPTFAHRDLEEQFDESDGRVGYSSPMLYAGRSERLTPAQLDEITGYREAANAQQRYYEIMGGSKYRPAFREPSGFEFHGTDGRWEMLASVQHEWGWNPDEVPEFEGIVVAHWVAHANPESRRLRLERVGLELIHHVPVDLSDEILVPNYDEFRPGQSMLRAATVCELVNAIDWPHSMNRDLVDKIVEMVRWIHRPWRTRREHEEHHSPIQASWVIEQLQPPPSAPTASH